MSDDLNAKATVEVDFIANGLTQLISGIGQLNEAQGFTNKQNVQLEQGLTSLAAKHSALAGAVKSTTTATSQSSSAWDKQDKIYNDYLTSQAKGITAQQKTTAAEANAAAASDKHTTSLIATRYALYDVSNAVGIAGIALTGFAALAYKTAIDYQSDFAAVQRTTGLTGDALSTLEANLIGVSQALPASFSDIASVAALGGQLGIANSQLLDFTTNVIKFSATTNVSVDDSATAFGRLNALLPDVQGNYNGLGSSILKVGINSVATESQIITIASRIAGIGASAGLTSDQVIGLSGALASLGVQPYGASGTVTRLFTKIETAVSQGGAALEAFGNISGESGKQFDAAWGNDKTATLEALFSGINAQGPDAIAAIQSLGLTSAQDLPNILKLSQNVDLVKSSLSDAKSGMEDGSQLTQSYGIIADTVAAKLKILGNNFSALEASIGDSSTGIGGFIDLLNQLLAGLTAISKNPVESYILSTGVALVGLTGLTALAAAAFLRLAATAAAVTTAQGAAAGSGGIFAAALNILSGAAGRASVAETGLITQTTLTSGAMDAAASSTGLFAGASVGLKAGVIGLAAAIALYGLDSLAKMGDAAANNTLKFKNAKDALAAYDQQVAAGTPNTLAGNGNSDTNRQLILQKTTGAAGDLARTEMGSGVPGATLVTMITGNQQAQESIDKIDASMGKLVKDGYGAQAAAEFAKWSTAAKEQGVSTKDLNALFPVYEAALKSVGTSNKTAAADQAEQTQAVSDSLSAASDALDATLKQENALYSLGDSLGSTSKDFSAYSANGRANLANLEAVVAAVSASTAGDAQATADNLQGLFNALTQGAQIPAAALTFLSDSIANLGVKSIVPTTFDLASFNQGLGDGTTSAAKAATSAANTAAKAIRTLVDYGSDLSGVFTRAFDIRFSGQTALDAITTAWSNIKQAATDAAAAELKAQATLDGLVSDRAIDEYYLKVANAYGDTLRASQIQADLAQNASDTADAQKDLTSAQDASSTSLVGNSDAAVANRSTITGLISDYETYISTLASSGLSQTQLTAAVAKAKQSFIDQATALGFSKTSVTNYAKAFNDMGAAIKAVPRNVNVTANADPAIQALNEFMAKAKSTVGTGISVPVKVTVPSTSPAKIAADKLAWTNFLAQNLAYLHNPSPASIKALQYDFVNLTGIKDGFASGGYTGDGGKYQPAGVVHKGEFVFSKEATSRIGVNNLAYAHSQAKQGYADGGFVGGSGGAMAPGYTQLAPFDRQLLVDIRQAIDRNQISPQTIASLGQAQATNSSYRRAA